MMNDEGSEYYLDKENPSEALSLTCTLQFFAILISHREDGYQSRMSRSGQDRLRGSPNDFGDAYRNGRTLLIKS